MKQYCAMCDKEVESGIVINYYIVVHKGLCKEAWDEKEALLDELFVD